MLIIHSHFVDQTIVVTEDIGDGWNPGELFQAANRLDHQSADCRRLSHRWQQAVRVAIDEFDVPSQSVGDQYVLASPSGMVIDHGQVEPLGWSKLTPERVEALITEAKEITDVA